METAEEDRHAAAHWLRPRLDRRADLTVQRKALATLGVTAERIYVDYGSTGPNRERPGRREALAACRGGDTLVVINSTGWRARCLTPV